MLVRQYDIVLDVSVQNRTEETLQQVGLELATMGDLKLVERPSPVTLAPDEEAIMRCCIKVSSTETGVIFGNIVYNDGEVVVLSDIHLDIMDYIHSQTDISDSGFRTRWQEFEWENKVAINTTIETPEEYLQRIEESTKMRVLNPRSREGEHCGYLAANLYTKSVFGEEALVNISVEKSEAQGLVGYVRIRSKTQGIALSLGDKITISQK